MSTIDEMLASAMEFKDEIDLDSDDFLEHYGRKGMKWYQHIFGDKDSRAQYAGGNGTGDSKKSSSASGRFSTDEDRTDRKQKREASKAKRQEAKEAKAAVKADKKAAKQAKQELKREAVEAKKEEMRKAEYEATKRRDLKDAAGIYKNRNKYSREEIAEAVKNVKWERELKDLKWEERMRGKRRVDDIVSSIETGSRAYNDLAKIYNAFSGKDAAKLPIIGEKKKKKNNSGGNNDDD